MANVIEQGGGGGRGEGEGTDAWANKETSATNDIFMRIRTGRKEWEKRGPASWFRQQIARSRKFENRKNQEEHTNM